jgi:putative tryptophan/tyrosine transport system substrate-binding protein
VIGYSRRQVVQRMGVAGLGLVAGCGRLPWQGQAPAKVPRIGVLAAVAGPWEGLRQGLVELGYVEGQNVTIDWRSTEGDASTFPAIASELVGLAPDIIVAAPSPGAVAAKDATATIPIVMVNVGDPVGYGLVESLARPGGNVTGLSSLSPPLAAKRVELMRDVVGTLSQLAVLTNALPDLPGPRRATEDAAAKLGIALQVLEVGAISGLEAAFATMQRDGAEALMVLEGPLSVQYRVRVVELAAQARLPALYSLKEFATAGGLISYGVNLPAMFHRAAYYVDRILKGAKPADLPVEQPREFTCVINLKTGRDLGLTIPPHVLAQATEVLQ